MTVPAPLDVLELRAWARALLLAEGEIESVAEAGRTRSANARAAAMYRAGLDTYATKKYGDDWQWSRWGGDIDDIEEEYDRWLERKKHGLVI